MLEENAEKTMAKEDRSSNNKEKNLREVSFIMALS